MGIRNTINLMNELVAGKNGICLSKRYVNSKTKLQWQCERGHIWETTPSHIRAGSWCHVCGRWKKY